MGECDMEWITIDWQDKNNQWHTVTCPFDIARIGEDEYEVHMEIFYVTNFVYDVPFNSLFFIAGVGHHGKEFRAFLNNCFPKGGGMRLHMNEAMGVFYRVRKRWVK